MPSGINPSLARVEQASRIYGAPHFSQRASIDYAASLGFNLCENRTDCRRHLQRRMVQ